VTHTAEVDRRDDRVRCHGPALWRREARAAVVADAELSPESGHTAKRPLDCLLERRRLRGEHVRASVERATVQEHAHRPGIPVVTPPLLAGRLRHQEGDGVAVALVADWDPVLASGPAPVTRSMRSTLSSTGCNGDRSTQATRVLSRVMSR